MWCVVTNGVLLIAMVMHALFNEPEIIESLLLSDGMLISYLHLPLCSTWMACFSVVNALASRLSYIVPCNCCRLQNVRIMLHIWLACLNSSIVSTCSIKNACTVRSYVLSMSTGLHGNEHDKGRYIHYITHVNVHFVHNYSVMIMSACVSVCVGVWVSGWACERGSVWIKAVYNKSIIIHDK